ncbi:hypothetical protein [Methanocaldococcus fervens]|uniref:Antitoxin SocA-like Panacea domain-containing protein n=1 Tax=Methanocaldococcus fervens (strain DSM 4213 / JCM 15782 / AG86) TaxID=573064 RepID=C7P736_METFA|nr:hypothetical protein [Methanocaldococcus fervens]ACV24368.1 hypothetical protein Mefer_0547 [Methanocaldococcus fervens AG86]
MLSENQQKIHYIINLLTNGGKKKWVKQTVLFALIYYFIKLGIFRGYDYAPTPFMWEDKIKFINISYDAINDLNFLLDNNYLNEILLSVKGLNEFIVGYSIRKKIDYNFNPKDKEIIDNTLFENGNLKEIQITEDGAIIKSKKEDIEIKITNIDKISYKSKSYIMKVSLWDSNI